MTVSTMVGPGRGRKVALAMVCVLALAAGAAAGAAPAAAAPAGTGIQAPVLRAACPDARRGFAQCLALFARQVKVDAAIAAGVRGPAVAPSGWGAAAIESAYKLPVSRDPGQTVAVVDAYNTPDLASDLAVYRSQYGLPACTTASLGDLAAAEDTAARLGAQVISNSYGTREYGCAQVYAAAYHHPGHVIVASSGDDGFTAASFPANLATVTAAGGTELARAANARGWSERVWNTSAGASGSGCSAYVAKPSWQYDPHCPGRTVADVAALAWNVAVYDSAQGGWLTVGGTSAAAPLIAGVYGLVGNAATIKPGYEYAHAGSLFGVTTGNNDWLAAAGGAACGHDYLCVAKKGYDAPTGLGTPDGTAGF